MKAPRKFLDGLAIASLLVAGGTVTVSPASATGPQPASPRLEAPSGAHRASGRGVALYDQTDSPAGVGFISQLFEPANAAFDSRAADDFTVPAADVQWDVAGVEVLATYVAGAGPAPMINVEFFADAGGLPGAASCSYPGLVAGVDYTDDGAGNLDITLPAPCSLTAGDYWVSVQADMDLAVGQWFWSERSVQNGANFAWENPADGFGTGCTAWTSAAGCGAVAPDLLFALSGVVVPVELQAFDVE